MLSPPETPKEESMLRIAYKRPRRNLVKPDYLQHYVCERCVKASKVAGEGTAIEDIFVK